MIDEMEEIIAASIKADGLFEINEKLTRSIVRENVEKFIRANMTRHKLEGYLVICDETNNTEEEIERNELRVRVDIYPESDFVFISNFTLGPDGMKIERSEYKLSE